METTFQLTLDDWNAFERAVKGRSFSGYLILPLALILVTARFLTDRDFQRQWHLLQLRFRFGTWSSLIAPTLWLVLPFVLALVFYLALLVFNRRKMAKQPMFVAPITMRLNEEGIEGTGAVGRDTIFWKAVHKIIETPTHLFVLNSPQGGFIIPKRAFASEEEAARFIGFARENYQSAQPQVPPISQP